MRKCWIAALALVLIMAQPAAADEVKMKNGDRISGAIVKMEGGSLIINTDYAGELKIKWDQVAGLVSEGPIAVQCSEGLISGTARECPMGQVDVQSADGKTTIVLAQVEAINPKDKSKLETKGGVNLSAWSKRGNTHKDNYDLLANMTFEWDVHRVIVQAESHYTEDKSNTTEENSLGSLEYNRFISEKVYAFANAQASQDKFKDINLRTAAGLGLGYQFLATDRTNLSFEVGPNYVYEDGDIRGTQDWFAWRWEIDFDYWIWEKVVQVYHQDWGLLRMDDQNQYFLNTYTGLKFPLGMGFNAKLQFDYNWDNNPQPGKEKYDQRTMLLFGYSW